MYCEKVQYQLQRISLFKAAADFSTSFSFGNFAFQLSFLQTCKHNPQVSELKHWTNAFIWRIQGMHN